MLLDKTTTIKWNKNTKNYYESKGYVFTQYDDAFEINLEDVYGKGYGIRVNVICDKCGKTFSLRHDRYLLSKDKGICYCRVCASSIIGNNTAIRAIRNKEKNTFHDWCIKYNNIEFLDLWDYEKNKTTPDLVSTVSHKKYYFKCKNNLHDSHQRIIYAITKNNEKSNYSCLKCDSFAQYLINSYGENAIEKYWGKKNTISPWDVAKRANYKIFIVCQEVGYHEEYEISPANFTAGKRCSYCKGYRVRHIYDTFGYLHAKSFMLWSNKNKKSPYDYLPGSGKRVYWKCENNIHQDYLRSPARAIKLDYRCPICVSERSESFLHEKSRLYISNELKLRLLQEHSCSITPRNPKTGCIMPFDLEIADLKLLIEVNGEGHYSTSPYRYIWGRGDLTPEQQLHKRQLYDRYKKIVALSNGYHYIAIPYWTDDKDETWKTLIDTKIAEILSQSEAKTIEAS